MVNRWRKNWQILSLVEETLNAKIVSIVRNGKKATVSRKIANILSVSRNSHHLIVLLDDTHPKCFLFFFTFRLKSILGQGQENFSAKPNRSHSFFDFFQRN